MLATAPSLASAPWPQADAMYLLLLRCAEEIRLLADPAGEEELDLLWNAIDAYEASRWRQQTSGAA
jgi:hypothetical protein